MKKTMVRRPLWLLGLALAGIGIPGSDVIRRKSANKDKKDKKN